MGGDKSKGEVRAWEGSRAVHGGSSWYRRQTQEEKGLKMLVEGGEPLSKALQKKKSRWLFKREDYGTAKRLRKGGLSGARGTAQLEEPRSAASSRDCWDLLDGGGPIWGRAFHGPREGKKMRSISAIKSINRGSEIYTCKEQSFSKLRGVWDKLASSKG